MVMFIFILCLLSTIVAQDSTASTLIIDDVEYKCGSTNTEGGYQYIALDNIYVCLVFDNVKG